MRLKINLIELIESSGYILEDCNSNLFEICIQNFIMLFLR